MSGIRSVLFLRLILPPFLLLVLDSRVAVHTVQSVDLLNYNFRAQKSKSVPNIAVQYASVTVRSFTFCTILCARDVNNCKAVYADTPTGQTTCSLFSETIAHLDPGNGVYASFHTVSTVQPPPTFRHGTYVKTVLYNGAIVAVYDFNQVSDSLKTFGLTYDSLSNKWPSMSSTCSDRLYSARGLSATVVSVSEDWPGGVYRMRADCQQGEVNWGDAVCSDTDGWHIDGDVGVACVSSTCYRVNRQSRAQYSGTQHHTRYGTGCTQWSNTYRWSSNFPLDGFDRSIAKNYCRDASYYARPWCYISPYWDYCNVPQCTWDPNL